MTSPSRVLHLLVALVTWVASGACATSRAPASPPPPIVASPATCAGRLGQRIEAPVEMMRAATSAIVDIAADHSGRCVYAITAAHDVLIWDLRSGELRRWKARALALSTNGAWVLTAVAPPGPPPEDPEDPEDFPGTAVVLWNLATGASKASVPFAWEVNLAAWPSADGKHAILYDLHEGTRVVWTVRTGTLTDLYEHDWSPAGVSLAPDGSHALVPVLGERGDALVYWNLEGKGPTPIPVELPAAFKVTASAVMPDGKSVLVAGGQQRAPTHDPPVWTIEGSSIREISLQGGVVRELDTGGNFRDEPPYTIVVSPDGKRAVTISRRGAQTLDLAAGRAVAPSRNQDEVTAAAYSADGQRLVTGGPDGRLEIRDARSGQRLEAVNVPAAHQGSVTSLAVASDQRWVASWGQDRTARIWSLDDGRLLHVVTPPHGGESIALAGPSTLLYVARSDGVDIVETATWKVVGGLKTQGGEVRFVGASTDGALVLVAESGFRMSAWDRDGRMLWSERAAGGCAALSPDGHRALAERRGRIVLIDAATGAVTADLQGSTEQRSIYSCAFSSDGKLAATGGSEQPLSLWDSASGTLLRDQKVGRFVQSIAFSPDGALVATVEPTGDLDRIAHVPVRRRADLSVVHTYDVENATVVAFTPRGELLVGIATGQVRALGIPQP
jgi:WD40 repeat protein